MTGYPWQPGDQLLAADLNAAFANPAGGPFLALTGGTMAGPLTLFGPPTADAHAATKAYVDAHAGGGGGLPDAPNDGSAYGRLNIAWTPVLPLTGGSIGGNLGVGGTLLATGRATLAGGVTVVNDATRRLTVTSTVADPSIETIPNEVITNLSITSNSAQDILSWASRMHIKTGPGVVFSSQHTPGFYGECSAFDTDPAGTVNWCSGVMGTAGNNGVGTVVNACDFYARGTINSVAGGVVTNHYQFFGPSPVPGRATNEYGFYVASPSGIGTQTSPTAWLEIKGPDVLAATHLLKVSSSSAVVVDVTANNVMSMATGTFGVGTSTPAGMIEVRGASALNTLRLLRVRNNAAAVLDIQADSSIGFNGATPVTKPTVSGSRATPEAALANLLSALASYGLITNSTTA
jgi:hypothetical protein